MQGTELQFSGHALSRQAQRNLSDEDIQFVLARGHRVYCAGALHIFLGRRDIPSDKETYRHFARLEGTVLVINVRQNEPILITTYRNRNGFKKIRSKAKYEILRQRSDTHNVAYS